MNQPGSLDAWQDPAIRKYGIMALISLLAVTMAMITRNIGPWSLAPLLVGCLGLALRWRTAPALVVVLVGWILYSERIGLSPLAQLEYLATLVVSIAAGVRIPSPVAIRVGASGAMSGFDMALCGGTVVYCVAHYRLLGLTGPLFPSERPVPTPRSPGWAASNPVDPRRPAESVTTQELLLPLVLAPVWLVLASLAWSWLSRQQPLVLSWPSSAWRTIYPELTAQGERVYLDLPPLLWRGMVMVWILGLGMLLVSGVIQYLGWRRWSSQEASLFLQDTLWRETCREQRLLHRWLVKARLRRRRREEKS